MEASSAATGLSIRRVPLDQLHLDPANARHHPEQNLDSILASLRRFGQAEPLVVQKSSGRVIGGNGRLVAMKKLGWTECDVVEMDVGDLEATALGIALNRTAELAEWNTETLARLLDELRAEDALDGVGFETCDIDALLDDLVGDGEPKDVDDPGAIEPSDTPVSRTGDLWILGDHRLLCGDSRDEDDVARLMDGETAQLLSTDPPYAVRYTGDNRPNGAGKDWSNTYREVEITDLGEFLRQVLETVLPHAIESVAVYVWHAHLQYPAIAKTFADLGILAHQPIIWSKPSSTFTHSTYLWAHEPCIFGWRKGHKPAKYLPGKLTTVWEVDWDGKKRFTGAHPTTKPTRLFEIPMEMHTRSGDVVLEPFSGSGSQLIAAEKLGRKCRAMEISPAFVDAAIRRWQKATGEAAMLEGDGRSFDDVSRERLGDEEVPSDDR